MATHARTKKYGNHAWSKSKWEIARDQPILASYIELRRNAHILIQQSTCPCGAVRVRLKGITGRSSFEVTYIYKGEKSMKEPPCTLEIDRID